ncbi:hypothetical protein CR513_59893, partial [Mucuna pruriens]
MVENQMVSKIKAFQIDSGVEYKPISIFKNSGIIHRIICIYTTKHNRSIEKKHKHLAKIGLTLLANGKDFLIAVFLINHFPTPNLQHVSLFKILYHKWLYYHKLRISRCAYYPHLRPYNKHKLDLDPTKYIGYSSKHKG